MKGVIEYEITNIDWIEHDAVIIFKDQYNKERKIFSNGTQFHIRQSLMHSIFLSKILDSMTRL